MFDVLKSDVANIKRWYLSFSHQTTKRLLQHLLEHLPALLAHYPCSVCYFNPQKSTTYYFASIIPINYTPLFHYIEKKREKRSQQIPGVKTQGKKVVVNLQEVLYPGLKSIKYLLPCCAVGPYSLSITPTPNKQDWCMYLLYLCECMRNDKASGISRDSLTPVVRKPKIVLRRSIHGSAYLLRIWSTTTLTFFNSIVVLIW